MKWFKHDANASLDAKLQRLRLKYGMEGYGLYWFCLEAIARNVEAHNLTFELEEDAELIAAATNIHHDRVQEMMLFMVNLGLFENAEGRITCLKMANRSDEYTLKLLRDAGEGPTKDRPTKIYFIGADDEGAVKIGVSANPWARLKEIQAGHHATLRVMATASTHIQSEHHVHKALAGKHLRGEWYEHDAEMKKIISEINCVKSATCDDLLEVIGSVVGSYGGATPELIPPIRTEQNRTDKKRTDKRFVPPTVDDVAEYLAERGAHRINPERFIDHYTANGWRVGKTPMKDWKAAVRTWISRQEDNHENPGRGSGPIQDSRRPTPGERVVAARERARQRERAQ